MEIFSSPISRSAPVIFLTILYKKPLPWKFILRVFGFLLKVIVWIVFIGEGVGVFFPRLFAKEEKSFFPRKMREASFMRGMFRG